MVDDRAAAKELDQWIDQLMDCKPLTEAQVKTLCDKVGDCFFLYGCADWLGCFLLRYRPVRDVLDMTSWRHFKFAPM